MFEYILLIIGIIIFLIDIFLLNTVFLGFLGVWMLSASVLYFIMSNLGLDISFNLGISLLFGLIPSYIYFRYITTLYKGDEKVDVNFDDKKLFGIRSNKGKIKKILDQNRYVVDVGGVEWIAESKQKLEIGDNVNIDKIEGNILIVTKDE